VLDGLRELVRRELVRPTRVSSMRDEEEFSFWHVLVRDVAYQQIPRAARAAKHVRAAEWIEGEAEDRVSDHAEILVHHYGQALELGRAAGEDPSPDLEPRLARFLILSGDRAMRLDMAAAEALYRRALAVVAEATTRGGVLAKLGDALQEQARLLEAEEVYEEALSILEDAGDERATALAKLGLARALWRHGRTAAARELAYAAVEALERDGPGPDLVAAYERAASADALGGRTGDAIVWAQKGIELAEQLGVENVVRHLQMRGLSRLDLGDRGGLDDMRDALELSLRLGLGIETGTSYLNYSEALAPHAPLADSFALLESSLDFSRRRGLKHHEMWTRGAMLWQLYETGRWDDALREADELIRWDAEQGGTQIEVGARVSTVSIHAQRGALDEARRSVAVFLPRAREIGDPQTLAPALNESAFVHASSGDFEQALVLTIEFEAATSGKPNWRLPWLLTALRIAVAADALELGDKLYNGCIEATPGLAARVAFLTGRAILAEAHGQREEAAALYREAVTGWTEWGSVVQEGYSLLGLGRCAQDDESLRAGLVIFERLRAVPFTTIAHAA
ncbi:MAG: hypothetical protein ACRDNY_07545, partial [Gaiellaceae bacterium]